MDAACVVQSELRTHYWASFRHVMQNSSELLQLLLLQLYPPYITQRYTFHAVKPFTAIILYYYIFIPNVFLVTTSCNGASQSENFTLQVLLLCVIMNRKLSCDYRLCMSACNYCTLSGKQLLRYFQLFLSIIVNSLLSFSSSQKQNELKVKGEL